MVKLFMHIKTLVVALYKTLKDTIWTKILILLLLNETHLEINLK